MSRRQINRLIGKGSVEINGFGLAVARRAESVVFFSARQQHDAGADNHEDEANGDRSLTHVTVTLPARRSGSPTRQTPAT